LQPQTQAPDNIDSSILLSILILPMYRQSVKLPVGGLGICQVDHSSLFPTASAILRLGPICTHHRARSGQFKMLISVLFDTGRSWSCNQARIHWYTTQPSICLAAK